MGATPTPIEIFSIQRPTTEMVILQKKTLNFSCYMGRRRPLIFIICYGILGVVLLFQWGLARHGPTQDTLNASHSLTSLNITMDATKRKSHSQSTSQGLPLSLFEGDNKSLVVERVNEYFRESFQNLRREHQSQLLQLSDRRERRLEKFLEKARKEHSDWVQEALSGKSTWLGFTQTLTEYNKKLEKLEKDMRKEGLDSDTLFPRDVSNVIQEMPRTRISGFKFCSILNNAVFNPWVHICMEWRCF